MFLFVLNLILALVKLPAVDAATVDARCADAALARYCGIARDIAHVSENEPIAFEGQGAKPAAAIALVSVAWHESGFHAGVQDCSRCTGTNAWCDRGRSVSLFQLFKGRAWGGHTREELCSDNRIAAAQANRLLVMKGRRTGSPRGMFMSYAGAGRQASIYGGQIAGIFERLLDRSGYRIDHRAGPFVVVPKATGAASSRHGT